jgi:hypothetical protein
MEPGEAGLLVGPGMAALTQIGRKPNSATFDLVGVLTAYFDLPEAAP